MPIAYRCDPRRRLVVNVYDGDVSFEEWRAHIAGILEDPAWRATTKSLSDMSQARLTPLTDEHRAEMFDLFATQLLRAAGRPMAIIGGASPGTERDVERDAIARLGARPIVFTSLTTACIWLSVDEPVVAAVVAELRAALRRV